MKSLATEMDIANSFRGVADALRSLGESTRLCAKGFDGWLAATEPLWAIMPGEWPDNFVLLNRYVRTGVKPGFLFSE